MKRLIFPLDEWELQQMEKGHINTPHWHDVLQSGDVFMAVVGLKKNIHKSDYEEQRRRGINILAVGIDLRTLQNLRKETLVAQYSEHIELHIVHRQGYEKDTGDLLPISQISGGIK